jgi:hypothetical protein
VAKSGEQGECLSTGMHLLDKDRFMTRTELVHCLDAESMILAFIPFNNEHASDMEENDNH